VSLNSRLESSKEEKKAGVSCAAALSPVSGLGVRAKIHPRSQVEFCISTVRVDKYSLAHMGV